MSLTTTCIRRPVLSMVLNIVIVLFGVVSLSSLGVRDYPEVDRPVISVQTAYSGASADVIETKITEPLEQSINGIGGIRTLTSVSSDGRSRISVEFDVGFNLEAAANDVRDRVSRAMRFLPPDADNPVVTKSDANAAPIVMSSLMSATRSPMEISDYANIVLKERLQTIKDVSEVRIWGDKRMAVRLWLDPVRMAAKGVTPRDIQSAVERENLELPAGIIQGSATELTIRTQGRLTGIEDFRNLIVREVDGTLIRLRDVGDATEGPENEWTIFKRDGVPTVGVVLVPQPGANHLAIAREFYKRLDRIRADLPPDISLEVGFDFTKTISASVTEVAETILISFILVVLVLFLFLRSWRATLIPTLAIPISLIGGFTIMAAMGYSINILTLLGIVLATGMVVDDAIVVLENIYQKVEAGMPPLQAGLVGSKEIFFAVIATTVALVAVLLPVLFIGGLSGRLFREFGMVVAASVCISTFVSLTLTPMMCTRILKPHAVRAGSFYQSSEVFFSHLHTIYRASLRFLLDRPWIGPLVIVLSVIALIAIYRQLPTELAPLEDRNRFSINVTGQEGASFEYMTERVDQIADSIAEVVKPHERSAIISMVPGFGGASNSGMLRVILTDADKRTRTQEMLSRQANRVLPAIAGVRAFATQEQTIGDRRSSAMPVQLVLMAQDIDTLRRLLPMFLDEASQEPVFNLVDVDLKFNKPEITVTLDRDRARQLGVATADIVTAVQLAMSSSRYGYYVRNGQQYSIIGQVARPDRSKPADISLIPLRSQNGTLLTLDNLVDMQITSSPPQLFHFDRAVSATVSAGLAPGRTMGEGIATMQQVARRVLPEGVTTALSGPARDFTESSSNLLYTFLFALVMVYLVLAAQFESFSHPLVVMFTVPLALTGAVFALWIFGQSLNIFSQIGLIMLIGLVTKNGILIVEFANQRRDRGESVMDAVREAAVSRLRPILMTSLTLILGALPIALALGASARSRASLGFVIIGGMLFSLILSLYVVPAMYLILNNRHTIQPETQPPG